MSTARKNPKCRDTFSVALHTHLNPFLNLFRWVNNPNRIRTAKDCINNCARPFIAPKTCKIRDRDAILSLIRR